MYGITNQLTLSLTGAPMAFFATSQGRSAHFNLYEVAVPKPVFRWRAYARGSPAIGKIVTRVTKF